MRSASWLLKSTPSRAPAGGASGTVGASYAAATTATLINTPIPQSRGKKVVVADRTWTSLKRRVEVAALQDFERPVKITISSSSPSSQYAPSEKRGPATSSSKRKALATSRSRQEFNGCVAEEVANTLKRLLSASLATHTNEIVTLWVPDLAMESSDYLYQWPHSQSFLMEYAPQLTGRYAGN